MKNLILFFTTLCFAYSANAGVLIQDAIKENLITVKISTNKNSTHYNSPFLLKVVNTSKGQLDIDLRNGMILNAADDDEQDFIVTQEELLSLLPNQSKEVEIQAMCINEFKSAPVASSVYSVGKLANSRLRKLSSFIQENQQFEPDAQFLMWDIAEGHYSEDQVDDFVIDSNDIVWVIDVIEGERNVLDRTSDEYEPEGPTLMVQGEFTMYFSRPQKVHIAMFNAQNVLVKELFKEDETPTGETSLLYAFDSKAYPEEEYFVKLVVEGKVRFTRKIDMSY